MQWTKIPTNILIERLTDQEIVSIVKYQLLWADLEYQPDDKTALRYVTNKQLTTAKQWLNDIKTQVTCDIRSCETNRSKRKTNYLKNKTKTGNVTGTLPDTVPVTLQEQIRLDNIILDKKEIYKEKEEKEEPKLDCYGECKRVLLDKASFDKLMNNYGQAKLNYAIEKLDTWLDKEKNKKERNHNHRAYFKSNGWVWEGYVEHQNKTWWRE